MTEEGRRAEDIPASLPPDMPPEPVPSRRAMRRRRRRAGLLSLLAFVVVAFAGMFFLFGLADLRLRLPTWAVAEVEDRLNAAMAEALPDRALAVSGIEIAVDEDWVPSLALDDLRLLRPTGGAPLLTLPEARITFDPQSLLTGDVRPRSLRIVGASVTLRRMEDGSFDLAFGGGQGPQIDSFAALFDQIDAAFARPILSRLRVVQAEGLSLTLEDRQAGRTWSVGDGRLSLENRAESVAAELGLSLVGGGTTPAQAVVTVVTEKATSTARLTASVQDVAARDLAVQAAPLAPLAIVEAPISGRLAATLGEDGISALDARLDLSAGALRPTPRAVPIPFDRALMELGYDPAKGQMKLTTLEVDSPSLRFRASGHSYLMAEDGSFLTGPLGTRLPAAFLTQISVSEAMVDPEGLFEKPVIFREGAVDLRMRLDPFRVEIGQLALVGDGHRLSARGKVGADTRGWEVALDLALDRIDHDRLLALWPVKVVPRTRAWLAQNVLEGTISDVDAALRIAPGQDARLSMDYDFTNADVRFIRTLPPITGGSGYATVEGQTYTMVLSKGVVTPPLGGPIDMTGSVFSVLDFTQKPAQAEVQLKTASTLTAALSILNEPPFGFLTKAGRPVDLGLGQAKLDAVLRFPLVPKLKPGDVAYTVAGRVADFASDKIVKGKTVRAADLSLTADPRGLTVAGPGTLGKLPFDVVFSQPFGKEAGPATVEGSITLSPETLSEFGIALPETMLAGEGSGQVTVTLPKGAPAELALVSDLNRIGLTIPGTGWRKPPDVRGRLDLQATLSAPAEITRLDITAPDLSATGRVTLRGDGGLDRASFASVALGDWFRGGVDVIGRGKGRSIALDVTGGEVDLRLLPDDRGPAGDGSSDLPITARLDRLQVTESIALNGLQGAFTPLGGFNGSFTARVNEGAVVQGTVVPSQNGTAVRIRSDDAGGVAAAAGVFASARGGVLDMTLTPNGRDGQYEGTAQISRVRVVDAPVLADLLSAVSVVGLLEQLTGSGIVFSDVTGDFLLTPAAVEIRRGSAVGASLGISMAGVYETRSKGLALQGVVSPLYLVNGIGSAITQRGEGVFGFNYELRGTADDPDVRVNPLSILTPGRLREIFRRPAPTLGNTQDTGG